MVLLLLLLLNTAPFIFLFALTSPIATTIFVFNEIKRRFIYNDSIELGLTY